MSIDRINGINGAQHNPNLRIDQKELDVARKLVNAGIVHSVQEFMQLSDTEKQKKVEEYNKTHPNEPIGEKNKRETQVQPPESHTVQQPYGSVMNQFMNDVNWKKIKLQ